MCVSINVYRHYNMVEARVRNAEVVGSIPSRSTTKFLKNPNKNGPFEDNPPTRRVSFLQ